MSEPKPISWEAVKALAMVVGVREAARRMQLSEEQVKKRCTREGWLASPEAKACNKLAIAQRSGITVSPQLSPAALIQAEIASLGSKTRLSIARGIAKAGEHVEAMTGPQLLDEAQNVKAVAQTADLVHGWKDSAPQVKIRLDVLSNTAPEPVIDVESVVREDVTPSDAWASDDVDDY